MQEIFESLSKFEFTFFLLIALLLSMFFCYFFKTIKAVGAVSVGILLALFIFELILASINPPLLIRGIFEVYSLDTLQTKKIRHLMFLRPDKKMFIRDFNQNIDDLISKYKDIVFNVIYEIYCNTFRYTKGDINSNDAIVFLGCSVVFGHGIPDDQTLPYYLSEKYDFKYNVLNCAVGGMGTNLALNIINSNIINKFVKKGSEIKYFIYTIIDDHIERNFRTSSFNLAEDNYKLTDDKFSRTYEPFGVLKVIFKNSYIFNKCFLYIIDEKNKEFHEQYLVDTVLEMKETVKDKYNAELIIVLWPNVRTNIVNKLKDQRLNVIELDKKFENEEYKIKNDGHPNAKANKEIAQILFDYINSKS